MEILNWIWQAITDEAISSAFKPRIIFFTFIGTVLVWLVSRTKTTADDELLAELRKKFFPDWDK